MQLTDTNKDTSLYPYPNIAQYLWFLAI